MVIVLPKLGPIDFDDSLSPADFKKELNRLADKYDFELPDEDKHGLIRSFMSSAKSGIGEAEKGIGATFGLPGLTKAGEELVAQAGEEFAPTTEKTVRHAWERGIAEGIRAEFNRYIGENLGGMGRYAAPIAAGAVASAVAPFVLPEALTGAGAIAAARAAGLAASPEALATLANAKNIAGVVGFGAADYPANLGENISAQQATNPNKPVDMGAAHAAALGQTVLDRFGIPVMGMLPKSVQKAFGPSLLDLGKQIEKGEITHEAAIGQLNSQFGNYLKGIGANYAGLVSMGVGDEAIRRAQAGQDFMGPEAIESYKDQLSGGIVPAMLFGGLGAFGQRSREVAALGGVKAPEAAPAVADTTGITALPQQAPGFYPPQPREGPYYAPLTKAGFLGEPGFYPKGLDLSSRQQAYGDLFGEPLPHGPVAPEATTAPEPIPTVAPGQMALPFHDFEVTPSGVVRTPEQAAQAAREAQRRLLPVVPEAQGSLFPEIAAVKGKLPEVPEPPAPAAPSTVLTAEALAATGLKKQSPLFKQLMGKDLSVPEDVQSVADTLAKIRGNTLIADSTKQAVHSLAGQLFNTAAKQQEMFGPRGGVLKGVGNGKLRTTSDVKTGRESVAVPSEPERSGAAPGATEPETGGVGTTPESPAGAGVGEAAEPSTLKGKPEGEEKTPAEASGLEQIVNEHSNDIASMFGDSHELLNNRRREALEAVGETNKDVLAPKDFSDTPAFKSLTTSRLFKDYFDRASGVNDAEEKIERRFINAKQALTERLIRQHGPEISKIFDLAKNKPEMVPEIIAALNRAGLADFDEHVIKPEVGGRVPVLKSEYKKEAQELAAEEREAGAKILKRGEAGSGKVNAAAARALVGNLAKRFPGLEVNYVHSIEELSPQAQKWLKDNDAEGARGYLTEDGKRAFIIGNNHDSLEEVKATVFHEALGHYGLRKKFRENLDSALMDLYNNNKTLKDAADRWLEKNPNAYTGADKVARAVDEVLAERSETGPKAVSMYQKIKNVIRNVIRGMLRKVGLLKDYSDSDVDAILADAHRLATKEGGVSAEAPGVFKRGENEHPMDNITSRDPERIRTGFAQINEMASSMPRFAGQSVENIKNTLSNVKESGVRRAILSCLRSEMIAEIYKIPGLKEMNDLLVRKQGAIDKHLNKAEDIFKRAEAAAAANPEAQKRLDKFAIDARLKGVDVLRDMFSQEEWEKRKPQGFDGTYAEYVKDYGELKTRYEKTLPADIQRTYREFRGFYESMMDEYEKVLFGDDETPGATGVVSPSLRAKLKSEFEAKRMRVTSYIPFMRFGDWVVEYADPVTGERAVSQFESARERQKFVDTQLKGQDVKLYKRIEDVKYDPNSVPTDSLIARIIQDMQMQKAPAELIDAVYQNYLMQFPAQSIANRFLRSENVLGVDPLNKGRFLLRAFQNVAPSWGRKLANAKYNTGIAEQHNIIRTAGQQTSDPALADAASHILSKASFHYDPAFSPFVHNATAFSYFEWIAGNVSSAVVHLTHMPLVVYPLLGAEHGFDRAAGELTKAFAAVNKGIENNPRYAVLYKELQDTAQIDHTTQREILQNRGASLDNMGALGTKLSKILSYPFAISEKYTRRVTAVGAYELALSKGMTPEEAARYATDMVIKSHTSGIAASAPAIMQNPLGRIFLTFKSFVWNTSSIFARSFYQAAKGESPEVRRLAQRQVIGMLAMATALAGVKGLPFYGAAEVTADMINALFGDDTPYDFNESNKQFFGDTIFKGLPTKLLNIDLADRIAYGQDLLFRDDPRMISQDGYVLWAMKNLTGPAGSYAVNVERAMKEFNEGNTERAVETMMPNFVKNGMKGFRYATEGATTLKGDPIQSDISTYNSLMQAMGFAPADLASAQETAAAANLYQQKVQTQRKNITNLYVLGTTTGDPDLIATAMERRIQFNQEHPQDSINMVQLQKAVEGHRKAALQSIDGIRFNPKLATEIKTKFDLE